MAGIGRDLLDLPFAEMVRNLAVAIADGQTALDRNSLETLQALVRTEVDVITDITEVIEAEPYRVDLGGGESVRVTGVRITPSAAEPIRMNMVQAGLLPTFYQFTEAAIEVRLSITMREERTTESTGVTRARAEEGPYWLRFGASRADASSVDYRSASKYNYQASGASILRATMRPVPPPARLEPAFTTVDTLSQPPTVTRTPR